MHMGMSMDMMMPPATLCNATLLPGYALSFSPIMCNHLQRAVICRVSLCKYDPGYEIKESMPYFFSGAISNAFPKFEVLHIA